MKISKERKLFLSVAFATSIISIIGFDVYARIVIGLETLIHAVNESLYYSGIEIVGTIWLIAPFIIIGLISASAARKDRIIRGWSFFILPIMGLYLKGHIDEAHLLEQKKWTASIFAVTFLPLMSIPILFVLGIALIIFKAVDKRNS